MKKAIVGIAGVLLAVNVLAGTVPFQASLTPEIAMYPRTQPVEGLTLSVWGENPQTSLAIGIVNGSTGDSAGFQWGFGLNYAESFTGIQWASINYSTGNVLGWQGAFVNYTAGEFKGLQTGAVNYAGSLTGLQLGFLNYAETAAQGVQIGLVNLMPQTTEWFSDVPDALAPGMIFLNWRF